MHWADAIFPFENQSVSSPMVRRFWRTESVPDSKFTSVAIPHWEMVFTKDEFGAKVVVRGPESHATDVEIPQDTDFFGIQFSFGAFMPDADMTGMADKAVFLPVERESRFFFLGEFWELPSFENAEAFVERLVDRDLLVMDPLVANSTSMRHSSVSERTVQRRMLRATGLRTGLVRQIERAQRAADMLLDGKSILDVVDTAGYSDQAHLTRSLKRFVGRTPKQLLSRTW